VAGVRLVSWQVGTVFSFSSKMGITSQFHSSTLRLLHVFTSISMCTATNFFFNTVFCVRITMLGKGGKNFS